MVYAALRWVARIALSWFYRDVELLGAERLPRAGPTILAVNHPNQLVDVLLVGTATGRRLTFTAKAVLFDNPLLARFLGAMGVVPLRRASDERERLRAAAGAAATASPAAGGRRRATPDPARNVEAFR